MNRWLFCALLLFSCQKHPGNGLQPGVVLTFDDKSITAWYSIRDTLNKYNANATFYISNVDQLTPAEVGYLKALRNDGHEIACHGLNHIAVKVFLKSGGTVQGYMQQEVLPAIQFMEQAGFNPQNFAYPHGSRTLKSDSLLLQYFNSVRFVSGGAKDNQSISTIDEIFIPIDKDQVRRIVGLGIDNRKEYRLSDIKDAFERAQHNKEVVIFYAHKPASNTTSPYEINTLFLDSVLSTASKMGLKFYTINDIATHK